MFGNICDWNIEQLTGYKPISTYYVDFGIAEMYGGEKEVRALYKRAFNTWKKDIKWITEICMVLNWKIHEHYEKGNRELTKLYDELWGELDRWILEYEQDEKGNIRYIHFPEEEVEYFLRTVD